MNPKDPAPENASPADRRVLLVDDHPFLLMGLARALAKEPGLSVCGTAGSAEEALTAVGKLEPDLVLTDLNLPGKSGVELIKDLANLRPGLPVIALSMHEEEVYAERCIRAGARGYVMKSDGPEIMAAAIRHVFAGGIHVSGKTAARILAVFAGQRSGAGRSALGQLTDRELELFQWIGRGLSTQEIADRLHISAKTVETHRMHIKEKLGLGTAAELIAYAARWMAAGS